MAQKSETGHCYKSVRGVAMFSAARATPDFALILRRANVSRQDGSWQREDYDVFDGDREIGRIYLVVSDGGRETWFWGVSFQVTRRKSYGYATSLEEAKVAFKAQYLA